VPSEVGDEDWRSVEEESIRSLEKRMMPSIHHRSMLRQRQRVVSDESEEGSEAEEAGLPK
jgi:hypothetical protein